MENLIYSFPDQFDAAAVEDEFRRKVKLREKTDHVLKWSLISGIVTFSLSCYVKAKAASTLFFFLFVGCLILAALIVKKKPAGGYLSVNAYTTFMDIVQYAPDLSREEARIYYEDIAYAKLSHGKDASLKLLLKGQSRVTAFSGSGEPQSQSQRLTVRLPESSDVFRFFREDAPALFNIILQ